MSLQQRTLVVKNFDEKKTTHALLKELCIQGGPVRNVVIKPDHAFVEFEDVESVGYTKALLDGVVMFGKKLVMEPKLRDESYFRYTQLLHDYMRIDRQQRLIQQQQQIAMQQQQHQQALGFYNAPQQFAPIHSSQSVPDLNLVQNNNVGLFNYNPITQAMQSLAQNQPTPSAVNTSSYPNQQQHDIRRARSFNQHHNSQYRRPGPYEGRSNRNNRPRGGWDRPR